MVAGRSAWSLGLHSSLWTTSLALGKLDCGKRYLPRSDLLSLHTVSQLLQTYCPQLSTSSRGHV
jgi:hypothetical protein